MPKITATSQFANAIQLLTGFTGKNAKQYAPSFTLSADTRIRTVEIHAVGTHGTTARYSSHEKPSQVVNTILRIKTADGMEGVSGVDVYSEEGFSDQLLLELERVSDDILNLATLDPVEVGNLLAQTHPTLSDAARSSIDIALWDLAARRTGVPLHKLLGARRNSIQGYASLPFYPTLPEYIEAVGEYAELGFDTFKFHVWGKLKEDMKLVELVQQSYPSDTPYRFMIDAENAYSLEHALELGTAMDQGLFIWLEAPLQDDQLERHQQLKHRLAQTIVPAGYTHYSADFIRQGIQLDAWDAGRFDATVVGGISRVIELLTIANAADLPIEIQSWGHTLSQACNLHLMLANQRTRYFEAAVPTLPYEFGMKKGIVLKNGHALAPEEAGLGVAIDWNRLKSADFYERRVKTTGTGSLAARD